MTKTLELKLTTAVEKQIGKFNTAEIIPAGTTGIVIDIMLEPEDEYNPVMFLLEFEDSMEWYTPEELEGLQQHKSMINTVL